MILRKDPSRLLGALWLGFSGLGLAVVLAVGSRYPVNLYVRNALFSQVFDTGQIRSDDDLNALLARKMRFDPPHLKPRSVFSPSELASLDRLVLQAQGAQCRVPSDHPKTRLTAADCTARAISEAVSPYTMGGKCGLDGSIRARIGFVSKGVGCCSDYNEAFLLRAQAVGLQAREVHNLGHTTAEYFDPAQRRWKWIDTSNRIQVSNDRGNLLSAMRFSNRFPWRRLYLVNLPPFEGKSLKFGLGYEAYLATANSVLFWTTGSNFQEQENFETPLRKLGLPKQVSQLASLQAGIRPGWIVLAPAEAAFRFRLSALLLKSSLAMFAVLDLILLLAALGFRVTRYRPLV